MKHTFFRSGSKERIEVDVLKGEGVSNTVVLAAPDKAWVATHDMVRERDGVQAAEMLSRFAPETGLLSIPLGFAVDVRDASEWRGLVASGRVSHQGRPHLRVAPERTSEGEQNPMESALFDQASHQLSQVTWVTRGGRVTFQFEDYKVLAEDLFVPHRVRVERNGQLVEEIEVESFDEANDGLKLKGGMSLSLRESAGKTLSVPGQGKPKPIARKPPVKTSSNRVVLPTQGGVKRTVTIPPRAPARPPVRPTTSSSGRPRLVVPRKP